jgi:hypothetical protein
MEQDGLCFSPAGYLILHGLGESEKKEGRSEKHVGIARSRQLAVFDTRLYIRVCCLDEPAERYGICGGCRSQLHVAHKLACAL